MNDMPTACGISVATSTVGPAHRLAGRIRLAAGIAATVSGATLWLADMARVATEFA